ncbi:MAG: ankyrin repeat domain-containing protein [Acidobacteriia bacterium]|nr:ankyrin repeat domain-containing protein [Terriglobia bacterium]
MRLIAALVSCLTAFAAAPSPVGDAAMKGDTQAVRRLIGQKADVNAAQPDGATAIQWAAFSNNLQLADLLIAAGANVKAANRDGATPLYLAANNGSSAMIERLLKAGADPNERNQRGETPLMFAARSGNVGAIKMLLDHQADVNAKESLRGTTALMWAVDQKHAEAVRELAQRGADVSAASNPDTKGNRAYLAPPVQARLRAALAAGKEPGDLLAPGGEQARVTAPAGRGGRGAAPAKPNPEDIVAAADAAAADSSFGRGTDTDGGGLTPLVFAARQDCLNCVGFLLAAGANVNQVTHYGWTPLLTAIQNRHYKLSAYLLEHGADPNIANNGGWTPLYLATDNRNIEGGDYPVRKPDMDHLEIIQLLLDKGANVNARICGSQSTPDRCVGDSTETRNNFTMQWLYEDGATPFLRAAQSGDVTLMKMLLARGADPKIKTSYNVTALSVAAGIGWVEGVTFEWSPEQNMEAIQMCLDLGIDVNAADDEGRAALHGAAHKGRSAAIQLLVNHGADLEAHDYGSRDTVNGAMKGWTWIPLHYAQGLARVGVQSALAHPETEAFIKNLMKDKGLPIPPDITGSICLTKGLNGCQ